MSTPDRMGERPGVNRLAFWLYVDAPRWAVSGGLLAVIVASVAAAGATAAPLSGDPVETLFQALVGATITGVTLVVTLNQLVLSQELGAVGDQRERLAAATEFRRDAERAFDGVAPTDPGAFLAGLLGAVEDRLRTAGEAVGAASDGATEGPPETADTAGAVAGLVEGTTASAGSVRERLDGAAFGSFAVTRAALDFDYSRAIDETRRVRTDRDLPPEADEALAATVELLELYGATREHVKTLYVQRALIDLSRSVLAAAVPALAVGIAMLLYYTPGGPGTPLVVAVAVGVVLAPFAVLVAHVVRLATVTGRTLSIGPFTLRDPEA